MTGIQKPLEFLVADDDPNLRDVLGMVIEGEGGNVTAAFDGQDAIAKYDIKHPDVVFTDLNMPRMTGVDVVRYVKEKNPGGLVYAITGAEATVYYSTLLTQLKEAAPTGIIPKPFELDGLLSLIDGIKAYVSNPQGNPPQYRP